MVQTVEPVPSREEVTGCERADRRNKKNYNPEACGTKTTFTDSQDEKAESYVPDEGTR